MRKFFTITTLACAVLMLSACDAPEDTAAPEPEAVEETPEPEPEPEEVKEPVAEAGTYGSDAALDRLYDKCEKDDVDACDQLYMKSPVGSEYESYALARVKELDPAVDEAFGGDFDEETEDFITEFGLQAGWDSLNSSDKAMACDAFNSGLEDFLYDSFVSGWDEGTPPTKAQFVDFMSRQC